MDSEELLYRELRELSRRGLSAPLGGEGAARLEALGIGAAARTRYGGFFLGPQSTENFVLATDGARVIAGVCQGNHKHTNTMVAGALALSELFERVCGKRRSSDLAADIASALRSAGEPGFDPIPTRVLGSGDEASVDFVSQDLAPADVVVLTSSLGAQVDLERVLRSSVGAGSQAICDALVASSPLEDRPDLATTFVVLEKLS